MLIDVGNEYTPTVKLVKLALVMAGATGPAGMMESSIHCSAALAVGVVLSVTFNWKLPLVYPVGVPEITPALDNVSVFGREFVFSDHVYGAVPKLAVNVCE
jgi:hypothetical protein